jgi:hypothetical protein
MERHQVWTFLAIARFQISFTFTPRMTIKLVVMTTSNDNNMELLNKVHAMMEVEARLTKKLEEVEPWLPSAAHQSNPSHPRVRPIPTTMEQVTHVLALARTLAARTSAPAGWNPSAPVVGFSTPSPMPHHLRGGALAALQLQRAQVAQQESKRQKVRQQQQHEEQEETQKMDIDQQHHQGSTSATPLQHDPKRRELSVHNQDLDRSVSDLGRLEQQAKQQQQKPVNASRVDVSMNLSDSSSSDDDED